MLDFSSIHRRYNSSKQTDYDHDDNQLLYSEVRVAVLPKEKTEFMSVNKLYQ
jgi:hypothetical protein